MNYITSLSSSNNKFEIFGSFETFSVERKHNYLGTTDIDVYCHRVKFDENSQYYRCRNENFYNPNDSYYKISLFIATKENEFLQIDNCYIIYWDSWSLQENKIIVTTENKRANYVSSDAFRKSGENLSCLFNYCSICSGQVYKPQIKCWACENGI